MLDWPTEAASLVGQLRAHTQHPKDPRGSEIVAGLTAASPKFVELWKQQTVRSSETSHKRFRHAQAGRLDLDYVKLSTTDDGSQQIGFAAVGRSVRREVPQLVAQAAAQQLVSAPGAA